jgi:hypothetical protein
MVFPGANNRLPAATAGRRWHLLTENYLMRRYASIVKGLQGVDFITAWQIAAGGSIPMIVNQNDS